MMWDKVTYFGVGIRLLGGISRRFGHGSGTRLKSQQRFYFIPNIGQYIRRQALHESSVSCMPIEAFDLVG